MSSVNTEWFRQRLAERKMSQRGLARALELDPAAVSLMLRGKREMKMDEAAAIADILGASAGEVMIHTGISPGRTTVVRVNQWMDSNALVHADNAGTLVPHPGGDIPATANACICRTAGTDLEHMDGWVMFCGSNTPPAGVTADVVGRLAFVKIRHSGTYIAKIARGTKRGYWTLHTPRGPMHDIDVEFAQPVLMVAP